MNNLQRKSLRKRFAAKDQARILLTRVVMSPRSDEMSAKHWNSFCDTLIVYLADDRELDTEMLELLTPKARWKPSTP